jgi:hypothetical protein
MSSTIDQAFVKQYSANIFHLSQQKGSHLRAYVRQESQASEVQFFERLGATAAQKKVTRHSDTPLMNSQHSRRAVYLSDYEWADLIDKQDKVRTLIDPENPYVQSAMMALGRSIDDEIIAAALGTAYEGQDAGTSVILPATQYVGAIYDGTPAAVSNLNVKTLIMVKSKFGVNEVDPSEQLHIAVTQSQIDSLLNENKVTSADYAAIKALVHGEVDTFMGFKFHKTQRLPTSGTGGFLASINTSTGVVTLTTGNGNNTRRCFAWVESGIVQSTGMEMRGRIDERADKSYSTQVYASMSVGAARLEEKKVVAVLCTE